MCVCLVRWRLNGWEGKGKRYLVCCNYNVSCKLKYIRLVEEELILILEMFCLKFNTKILLYLVLRSIEIIRNFTMVLDIPYNFIAIPIPILVWRF